MKRLLICIHLLLATCLSQAGEIIVGPNQSLHEALRRAREWRRTNDPRCQGGITIIIEAGRYYMNEPLFLRPEDSGTKESPLTIRGIGKLKTSVICGDARQRHTQLWPLKEQGDSLPFKKHDDGLPDKGMERIIDFNKEARTITIPTPPKEVLSILTSHLSPRRLMKPPAKPCTGNGQRNSAGAKNCRPSARPILLNIRRRRHAADPHRTRGIQN